MAYKDPEAARQRAAEPRAANRKRYYLKNRARILEKAKVHYLKNRARILRRNSQYNRTNPVSRHKRALYEKKSYLKNQVLILARARAKYAEPGNYYQRNRDEILRRQRAYALKNRDRNNARNREWRLKNRTKHLAGLRRANLKRRQTRNLLQLLVIKETIKPNSNEQTQPKPNAT